MKVLLKELFLTFLKKMNIYFYIQYLYGFQLSDKYKNYKNEHKIFLMMTPEYGNLGDQAIEVATYCYLKKEYSEYRIIPVHLKDTYVMLPAVKNALNANDIVMLQGGGNFGNLYLEVERARRFIVSHISECRIVSLPCSITYTDTPRGRRELGISKRIYGNNAQFIIIGRDEYSFEIAKNIFPKNKVLLNPDMVFYLKGNFNVPKYNRHGILICLRTDAESCDNSIRDLIIKNVMTNFSDVTISDTQLYRDISDEIKIQEVMSIVNQFSKYEVVITDRLHGMLLAYISNTPCIVYDSLDSKVSNTYKWMQGNSFIFMKKISDYSSVLEDINKAKNTVVDNKQVNKIKKYFDNLKNDISR